MYDKSGRLVDEKNVLVLVDDVDVRLGVQVRFLLAVLFRLSEKLIIDVQLQNIALLQPIGEVCALAVDLDALDADILVHHAAGQQRDGFF